MNYALFSITHELEKQGKYNRNKAITIRYREIYNIVQTSNTKRQPIRSAGFGHSISKHCEESMSIFFQSKYTAIVSNISSGDVSLTVSQPWIFIKNNGIK